MFSPDDQTQPEGRTTRRDDVAETGIAVSVVIPVLNGAATISEQLSALAEQQDAPGFEIVVADNGSTDATRMIVQGWQRRSHGQVRLVDASAIRCASAARNVGWRAARGDKILMCDADDRVAPGWVAAMAAALDTADMVGGTIEYALLNPHFRDRPPNSGLFWESGVRWPLGACCGFRRTLLERLDGYDDSWKVGCEDIEIALRAARIGVRAVEAPGAVVHKRERGSRRALARQFYRYGQSHPRLVRAFPDIIERRGTLEALRQWARFARLALSGRAGHRDIQRAALNLGRIVGSMRMRTWAP